MSNRQLNDRIPAMSSSDGSSPYKRPRDQSPGAVVQAPAAPPSQRPATYPYTQDTAARYGAMHVPNSYAMYSREPFQAERGDYRREMEITTRRRPTLLENFPSHAAAMERKHAQEQRYQYSYPDREAMTSGPYSMNRQPAMHPQPTAHPPAPPKRPKLVEARPELTQPLRIDTGNMDVKREPAYTPQVEAISPTLPSEDTKSELSAVQSSKEELLSSIHRIDLEIGKVEMQITKLKKKQSEFETEAAKPPEVKASATDIVSNEPKNQSMAQVIYAENRKRANAAHSSFIKLGHKIDLPLYNQPSDTPVYHENKRNHLLFKKKLLLHFKKKHHSKILREKYLTDRYDQLMQGWIKRLERSENNAKKRAKDTRTREFFEKIFPELKKQREDKERIQRAEASTTHNTRVGTANRVAGYARSEAELEQIMDGLHEQEEEEKKMRSYAVIPPMLFDARQRMQCFHNNNGLIEDAMAEYNERQHFNTWNQAEKDLFKERFLQHPKNFGYIASFLERKSVQDCVQYYYLSKKNENYKQLLRKQSVKKRKFPKHVKPIRPDVNDDKEEKTGLPELQEPVPIINTATERKPPDDRDRPRLAAASVVTTSALTSPIPVASSSSASAGTSSGAVVSQTDDGVPEPRSDTPPTSSSPSTTTTTSSSVTTSVTPPVTTSPVTDTTPSTTTATVGSSQPQVDVKTEMKTEIKAEMKTEIKTEIKEEVNEEVKNEPMDVETTVKEEGDPGTGTHTCAVCKSELENVARSRPLTKSNCENYNIKEDELTNDMRVCSSCRCRSVRKRYTHCPVPMCKTPKRKVKRLRPLPSKWAEIPDEIKEPIINELQLNDEITKCCSACFNRIARRLGNNPQTNEPLVPLVSEHSDDMVETPRWTEQEMDVAKQGLREHGRDFSAIAAFVGTKSEAQCKNFYFNYKKKFSLEQLIDEHRRNKIASGESDGRTVSISESVASTITAPSEEDLSSSDEDNGEDNDDSSDTASAPSPMPTPRSDQRLDSTTVDAMEMEDEDKKDEKPTVEESIKPAEGLSTANPNLSASQGSLRSIPDYDSSATLSADEGPPSSTHHEEKKPDAVSNTSSANTATSETYISSTGRTISNSAPQPNNPPQAVNHSRPTMKEGEGRPPSQERQQSVVAMMEKKSPPACVRDLIDCAIERNIVQDVNAQKEMAGAFHHSSMPNHSMVSQSSQPPRMAYGKEGMKEMPHREAIDPAIEPRTGSPYPLNVHPRDMGGVQDLSRRPASQPLRNASPQTAYKGDPKYDFDPRDPKYHEMYRPAPGHEPQSMVAIRAPPPAHSHHPSSASQRQHYPPSSDSLHQLAAVASDREPQRTMAEVSGSKLQQSYHQERSQMTPPNLRQSASPFGADRMGQHGPPRSQQMARPTIGQPPPLININQGLGSKVPIKSEKMSPIAQPPTGSITQGTPVQQPPTSQPQTSRYEGSISMGTPRYDPGMRGAAPHSNVGSISMGTPRYETGGGGRVTPEGQVPPRMVYEAGMRMMYNDMFRRQQQAQSGFYPPGVPYASPQTGAQYPAEQLSSSRAVLMGDFLTAQQMQHAQDAQRRADKDRQLSPRSREQVGREGMQVKTFPTHIMESGMPPPFSPMYVHQVPVSSAQDRGGRTSSPMPSRTATPPRSDSGPGWPQGHPQGRPQHQPQVSPGGQGPPSTDRRHPTPPPPRQNVIRSITHGTAGGMIMDRMPSPHAPSQPSHLHNNSRLATLVEVATNAPSLAVPPKDRHQLSPSPRDHQSKERAHVMAMEQEREWQEREKERRDAQAREVQLREAQAREAQAQAREAQAREAQAQAREAQAREAQAREAQAREHRLRELERDRLLMAAQQEHQRNSVWYKMEQERKEMEARQVNAERERHKREELERERHEMMMNEKRPASQEAYHPHQRSVGGTMRTMDRPPDGRPPPNHMEGHPQGYYPQYMAHQAQYQQQPPPRSEASSIAHRPPSRETKQEHDRRMEYSNKALKKDVPQTKPSPGGGGGAGGTGPNTFTAATLIDAIIIHQINNGSHNDEDKVVSKHEPHPSAMSEPGSKYLLPTSSPSAVHQKVHRGQPSPHGPSPHSMVPTSSQPPHSSSMSISQPPQLHPGVHYPRMSLVHPCSKPDPGKDQRSPPYKPHKTIAKGMDPHSDGGGPPNSSSGPHPHPGVSSSADIERSQEGLSAAEKAAQNAASIRAITLGEHIDAIIIQDYTQKGKGPSPNGLPMATEAPNMNDTSNAIKSFLASGGHHQQGEAPPGIDHRIPTSSPSQVASSTQMAADSSQRTMDARPRSMSSGGQHRNPMPQHMAAYPQDQLHPARRDSDMSRRDSDMGRRDSDIPTSPQDMAPSPHGHSQNGPHRHPSSSSSPQTLAPHSQPQPHRYSSQSPLPMRPGMEAEGSDGRPRSLSTGMHQPVQHGWTNWKLRRALEQQSREQQQGHLHPSSSGHMPQPGSVQSPVTLAPDEREIVKVARGEPHHSPADQRVSQSGQGDTRSPQPPTQQQGYNPISPTSSSTDSGGPEAGLMKASSPRSPRLMASSHPSSSSSVKQTGASSSSSSSPVPSSSNQPLSSLAASHQAITSLLSRPQNKQGGFAADSSSVMSQRGPGVGGEQLPPGSHRPHKSPLAYVQDKIAEVIQNPESGSRPSSTSSSSDPWDKRLLPHPLDGSGRFPPSRSCGVESSTHRDYPNVVSPMRDDVVSGSRQKQSPRPSVHSQLSDESQGSTVSSAEDAYNATSSTGMKPPHMSQAREYGMAPSPMSMDVMSRSPRPSYIDSRLGIMEGVNRSRSPKFSKVGTSDMAVPGSSDDPRPSHPPHRQVGREGTGDVDHQAAVSDSSLPSRPSVDNGPDSSAHSDNARRRDPGCQSTSSISSSKQDYMKADTQYLHPDPRTRPVVTVSSPTTSSSSTPSNAPSSSRPDNSRYQNSPNYPQSSSHPPPPETGVSTSTPGTGGPYPGHYLYPRMNTQHPHNGGAPGPRPSPAHSPSVNRDEVDPLLSSQYEAISDEEN